MALPFVRRSMRIALAALRRRHHLHWQHSTISSLSEDVAKHPNRSRLAQSIRDSRPLKILLFSNAENGLTKRIKLMLEDHGISVNLHEVSEPEIISEKTRDGDYDMIICPFLTKRVPKEVWQDEDRPCLIVHPGIIGDRGMSSLDWAIHNREPAWGVTVLEAAEEMDAGDIWSTVNFTLANHNWSKTGLYNGPVADAAEQAVLDAVIRFRLGIPPVRLDYKDPDVRGRLRPKVEIKDRHVDWSMPAEQIVSKIQMSDTRPGARATLRNVGTNVCLFGGHVQPLSQNAVLEGLLDSAAPGDCIAQKDEAILVKAGDGNGVWITHTKVKPGKGTLKLPSMLCLSHQSSSIPVCRGKTSWQEISSTFYMNGTMAVIHFDFYNGAMSTNQCRRLKAEIEAVKKQQKVKVIILLGGRTFFSTGIHLNVIEASPDPAAESWANINAINDVIQSFVNIEDKVTISALQGGAGAGGIMMAAAADLVWSRERILLTPSYKAMHLYGSEYWTFFLPKRVGAEVAIELTEGGSSITSNQAQSIGLVDEVFGRSHEEFRRQLLVKGMELVKDDSTLTKILDEKSQRGQSWYETMERHRDDELKKMKDCFNSVEYNNARAAFVYH